MNVVFLSTSGDLGGAERALLTAITSVRATDPTMRLHLLAPADGSLVTLARSRGIDAEVVTMPKCVARLGESALRGGGGFVRTAALAGAVLTAAPWAATYAAALKRRVDELQPDLVHCNGIKTHLIAWAVGARRPVVWHVQDFLSSRRLLIPALRFAAGRAAAAVAASNAVAEDLRQILPGLPVHVIANAVDDAYFSPISPPAADLDHAARLDPLEPGGLRIGLVATYARWKGHDVFLRAAAALLARRDRPAVRFYIVGGPIYQTRGSQFSESELRALADELGIAAHVGFVPFCQDPRPVYAALDVCVHASVLPEPFGLTIAEAMTCGRPVISTDGADIFEDEREGLRVERANAESLAGAMELLVRQPALRSRLAAAACLAAAERLGPQTMGAALVKLYRSIVAARATRAEATPHDPDSSHEPAELLAMEVETARGRS